MLNTKQVDRFEYPVLKTHQLSMDMSNYVTSGTAWINNSSTSVQILELDWSIISIIQLTQRSFQVGFRFWYPERKDQAIVHVTRRTNEM